MDFTRLVAATFCLLLASACVPVHVRTHGADENIPAGIIRISPEIPKGYIGGTLYSIDHNGVTGHGGVYAVEGNDKALEFKFSFVGKSGSTVRFASKKIRYRYSGREWGESLGSLNAERVEFPSRNPPRERKSVALKIEPGVVYEYTRSGDANGNEVVTFAALFPKEERDLDIELPEIHIGSELVTPKTLKFKWHERSVLKPVLQ